MNLKSILLCLYFLYSGVNITINAQLNYFLPDSNAYISVSPYKFWFYGDTLINSKLYKKVYVQSYDSIPDFKKASYFAAVREDTINEKIFSFQKQDSVERLIADFSVKSGDTVSVYTYNWILNLNQPEPIHKTSIIHNVDSILINGNYHKRVNILEQTSEWPYMESWIEGIGSTWGLFFPNAHIETGTIELPLLLCVHINNALFYNHYHPYCYLHEFFVNVDDGFDKLKIAIYPTFAHEKLYVNFLNINYNFRNVYYKIIDMEGRLMQTNFLDSNIIDILNLPEGIYIISFIDNTNNQYFINKRFLKTKN